MSILTSVYPFLSRTELDLSSNRLRDVSALPSLRGLVTLLLSSNRLAVLPNLSRLRCLSEVEVCNFIDLDV